MTTQTTRSPQECLSSIQQYNQVIKALKSAKPGRCEFFGNPKEYIEFLALEPTRLIPQYTEDDLENLTAHARSHKNEIILELLNSQTEEGKAFRAVVIEAFHYVELDSHAPHYNALDLCLPHEMLANPYIKLLLAIDNEPMPTV